MISKARMIEVLRSFLGDDFTAWLHALRYFWLLRTREENEVEMRQIPRLVREGDIVIDVGANSADWTWPLSRQVGNRGKVFAFEADPYYAEVTRKVITLLGLKNVAFFPYGLSDSARTARLVIETPEHERVVGTGHIIEDVGAATLGPGHTIQVKLMPLDEVAELNSFAGSIRLIKCDVEGHELKVFAGALNILNNSRPFVITEVEHVDYRPENERDLLYFFQMLNYNCYVVGPDGFSLIPSDPDDHPKDPRPNRIMIPAEKDQAGKDTAPTG